MSERRKTPTGKNAESTVKEIQANLERERVREYPESRQSSLFRQDSEKRIAANAVYFPGTGIVRAWQPIRDAASGNRRFISLDSLSEAMETFDKIMSEELDRANKAKYTSVSALVSTFSENLKHLRKVVFLACEPVKTGNSIETQTDTVVSTNETSSQTETEASVQVDTSTKLELRLSEIETVLNRQLLAQTQLAQMFAISLTAMGDVQKESTKVILETVDQVLKSPSSDGIPSRKAKKAKVQPEHVGAVVCTRCGKHGHYAYDRVTSVKCKEPKCTPEERLAIRVKLTPNFLLKKDLLYARQIPATKFCLQCGQNGHTKGRSVGDAPCTLPSCSTEERKRVSKAIKAQRKRVKRVEREFDRVKAPRKEETLSSPVQSIVTKQKPSAVDVRIKGKEPVVVKTATVPKTVPVITGERKTNSKHVSSNVNVSSSKRAIKFVPAASSNRASPETVGLDYEQESLLAAAEGEHEATTELAIRIAAQMDRDRANQLAREQETRDSSDGRDSDQDYEEYSAALEDAYYNSENYDEDF